MTPPARRGGLHPTRTYLRVVQPALVSSTARLSIDKVKRMEEQEDDLSALPAVVCFPTMVVYVIPRHSNNAVKVVAGRYPVPPSLASQERDAIPLRMHLLSVEQTVPCGPFDDGPGQATPLP